MLTTHPVTALNLAVILGAIASGIWVWRDATGRSDPWALTWGLFALLLFPIGLIAYLIARLKKVRG